MQDMFENIKFNINGSSQVIIIHQVVLERIIKYMQTGDRPESGGLLFAEFKLPKIFVKDISIPNKTDCQSRFGFKPDLIRQQKIINSNFKKGLHYIGEWHTHPENKPMPSTVDIMSMKETFIKSKHELNYFLLIIVGNKVSEDMFWIGLQNATKTIDLLTARQAIIGGDSFNMPHSVV
jgi:integrative and conjugative element protein (TIGR02256 family)